MNERTLLIEMPASDVLHMHIIRSQAAKDVLAERQRQQQVEGWTPEHDDEHNDGAMAVAAACYALADRRGIHAATVSIRKLWEWTGWASHWFKPKDTRRNLVRATALLLAEIERLDRRNTPAGVNHLPGSDGSNGNGGGNG